MAWVEMDELIDKLTSFLRSLWEIKYTKKNKIFSPRSVIFCYPNIRSYLLILSFQWEIRIVIVA